MYININFFVFQYASQADITAETSPPKPMAPSFKFLPVSFEYIYDP